MKIILLFIVTLILCLPSYAKRDDKKNKEHMKAHRAKMKNKREIMKEHREKMKSNNLQTIENGQTINTDPQQLIDNEE